VDRFRVVICGGGIAAIEGLLRLRTLAGDALDITLLAPNDELRYRALAVDEPFARGGVRRYPLRTIARRTGAEWHKGAAEWIDAQGQLVHTDGGGELPYDALLIAVGGRLVMPFEHVTVFDDEHADEGYHGLIQDVEGGYTRSVVLIVPEGHAWLLPVYELALMTAERAVDIWEEGLGISIVTPESAPLAALGDAASSAVGDLLGQAGVRVYPNARPTVPASQHVLVDPDGPELEASRIVALPRIEGRPLRNVPSDEEGFVPVDEFARVPGMAEHVYAAGDAANLPLKHGGLGAHQADVAAAGIAAMAGVDVTPEPLRPVIRAVLHTGTQPLYITARLADGRFESEVTTERAWPADEKVAAEELGPFLNSLD
jgi:sulfide:quinone oxidoreductase